MKTLLFTLEYPPFHGGVANYYGNLVKFWPKPGEISVLNNNNGRLINNKLPLLKWLPAYLALYREIKQQKIEHIIVGQILPLGTVALICSRFCKTKYSVFLHGMDLAYALKRPRKTWLAGKILSQADKIICTNSYTANLTKQFFPLSANKIATVNPGVENLTTHSPQLVTQLKNKYNLDNKIILLSVGRLVKRKGFDKVIEAMPEILKPAPNLVYIILGNGKEIDNLKSQISALRLEKNIIIIDDAADEEKNIWYDSSDIFIMAARNIAGDFEGFGIVYLEANLAGKPAIAGRSGGVGDAVVDGLNGLLVDPEDTGQIASAVVKLSQNTELRKKLGEQGRERAAREFNWEKQISKIYNFLLI